MQSTSARVIAVIVALVGALVLFLVLRDSGEGTKTDEPTSPAGKPSQTTTGAATEATIVIQNGKPVGGVSELEFSKGDQIRFAVDSDVDEAVHLHGYDVSKPVKAGGSVSFDLPANIEGVFSVELEESAVPIAEITVNP